MKLFYAFAMAAMFATSALATDTVMFDGCAAVKVDGTNYYSFVDPHCVTGLDMYDTTGAEERKAEQAAAAN